MAIKKALILASLLLSAHILAILNTKFLVLKNKKLNLDFSTANTTQLGWLIYTVDSKLKCLEECARRDMCKLAILINLKPSSATCYISRLPSLLNNLQMIDSIDSHIYINKAYQSYNDYLIHYWNFNNNLLDSISLSNLVNEGGFTLIHTEDRFNKINSSLYLNSQYLRLPSFVYFSGDFTFSAWVKLVSTGPYYISLLDCGFDAGSANVVLYVSSGDSTYSQCPYIELFNTDVGYSGKQFSPYKLDLMKWIHLVFTLEGSIGKLYINGVTMVNSNSFFNPRQVLRTSCFFGKSNWDGNPSINAFIDDIKIFNRSIDQNEVNFLIKSIF